jgi:hypothetical protein
MIQNGCNARYPKIKGANRQRQEGRKRGGVQTFGRDVDEVVAMEYDEIVSSY